MELSERKCAPCEGESDVIAPDKARELSHQIPDWQLKERSLERTFEFSDFAEAMDFANEIADIAKMENHHPDLHISWGKVKVELSTHKIGGLSQNDFVVAAKIDRLQHPE